MTEKGRACFPKMVNRKVIWFMDGPFNHLRFVTYCLLPFVYILVLNVLIVVRLRWTPLSLKPGFAGGNATAVSIGLEASSVGMATTEGGSSSTSRIANSSASASAVALRERQQVHAPRLTGDDNENDNRNVCTSNRTVKSINQTITNCSKPGSSCLKFK